MARSRRVSTIAAVLAAAVLTAAGGAAAAPVTFAWPRSVAAEPTGSLLVVENGMHRLIRLDPATGRTAVVSSALAKPYAVARAASGAVFLSDGGTLKRIAGKAASTVARAGADV